MTIDQIINLLVTVTLIEMMITVGMGVSIGELLHVAAAPRLVVKAALANYVFMPATTVLLLLLFQTPPLAAVGFLVLAVCPGAPYGPPFTAIGRGDVTVAVGMMVLLAGSSAIIAPLLLGLLLPVVTNDAQLHVDATRIAMTLMVTQLLPLAVGLCVRHWAPGLALRLYKSASLIAKILNIMTCGLILGAQYRLLLEIRFAGLVGMLTLLIASLGLGWGFGGPVKENRKALALATSLRNVGVGLVIVTGSFAGTPAVTAVLAYGILAILASLPLAVWWGKQ